MQIVDTLFSLVWKAAEMKEKKIADEIECREFRTLLKYSKFTSVYIYSKVSSQPHPYPYQQDCACLKKGMWRAVAPLA